MNVTLESKIVLKHGMTAGELAKVLAGFPAGATVTVTKEKYYDQRDPGQTYMTIRWTEQR